MLPISEISSGALDSSFIDELVNLSQEAGSDIMSFYGDGTQFHEKEDRSPLTLADIASHRRITSGLKTITPDIPVLSEESQPIESAVRLSWPTYWLVDPLDGTKEFILRNGEFTVNIALIEDHVATLGIVHAPAINLTYVGQIGRGAFLLDAEGQRQPISVKIPTSSPIRVLGSRSHPSPGLEQYLTNFGSITMHPVGSSLKFCRIAEGSADLYPRLGPTSEWDTAAGQAVLEAAGGHVIDLEGLPLRYNLRTSILNPSFIAFGDVATDWLPERKS